MLVSLNRVTKVNCILAVKIWNGPLEKTSRAKPYECHRKLGSVHVTDSYVKQRDFATAFRTRFFPSGTEKLHILGCMLHTNHATQLQEFRKRARFTNA